MSKRGNYPYLSADMFPQNPNITTSLRITSTTLELDQSYLINHRQYIFQDQQLIMDIHHRQL